MNLRVIKGGVLDTIQDQGRYGYQHLGINPCGAMDKFSAKVANILVGNEMDEAVIELHFPASEYFFEQEAMITITGADFGPTINGESVPINHPVWVNKFSVLQFASLKNGARAYLAVKGGFQIDKWLGSKSTNLKAAAGGFKGRQLKSNDDIPFVNQASLVNENTAEFKVLPYYVNYLAETKSTNKVYVVKGREWDLVDKISRASFLNHSFSITAQSDRMGYRLNGQALNFDKKELISSSVSYGTIQLLPDGQLIILMADHQTTGGYPRIAHVISAHHSMLAQKRAGEYLKFKLVEQEEADNLSLNQKKYLKELQSVCNLKY